MPWGVAAAAIGVAGGIYTQGKAEDAAKDASRGTRGAAAGEVARTEEATARARAGLQPYADQEAMARNQMMTQLGLVPGGGTNVAAGPGSGYPMGTGMVPLGGPTGFSQEEQSATGREGAEFQRFMQDMLGDQIAISLNAGYSKDKAYAEGARRAEGFLQSMKNSGDLPPDYETPSLQMLTEAATNMGAQNIDFGNYGLNPDGSKTQGTGPQSLDAARARLTAQGGAERLLPQYFGGAAQPGGPGGQPGAPGAMMGGAQPGAAGGVQNIQSIMQRAGASGLPEGFQDQYYQDVGAPAPDFGMGYTENPAYQKMIEETTRNVNQGAATAGGLYSGARGKALQEASAATQMNFYRDLADREQQTYETDLARRGDLMTSGQGREDQYYTNYMNLLGNMSSPTTATNIANLETGNAANIANINIPAQASINQTNLSGAAASNAATADIIGGVTGALSNPAFQGAIMGGGNTGGLFNSQTGAELQGPIQG